MRENVRLPRILPRGPRILQRRPLPRVVSWFHGAATWLQAFIHDITRPRNHAAASTRLRLGLDALAMLLGRRRDVLGVRKNQIVCNLLVHQPESTTTDDCGDKTCCTQAYVIRDTDIVCHC